MKKLLLFLLIITFTLTTQFAYTTPARAAGISLGLPPLISIGSPSNLKLDYSNDTQLRLTWSPVFLSIGTPSYRIYEGNTIVGTSNTESFIYVYGVKRLMTFKVATVDLLGNESAKSGSITVDLSTVPVIPPGGGGTPPGGGGTPPGGGGTPPGGGSGGPSSSVINATIISGSLFVENSVINFTPVTLVNDAIVKSTSTSSAKLTDNRGAGSGWNVNLSITDFISQSVNDPTTASGKIKLKIPAYNVQVATSPAEVLAGQGVDSTNGPTPFSRILSTNDQSLATADRGFGMGIYNFPLNYEITIPKTVKVSSIEGTDSKYKVDDEIGTMAGTYTSTFTYTAVSGL